MVRDLFWSALAEPAVPNPPPRVWRDWLLLAVLTPTALLEGILRPDVAWRPVALILGIVPVFSLLWRRTHPLPVVAIGFAAHSAGDLALLFGEGQSATLYTTAYVVLLPYALFRWGSGRDAALGLLLVVASHAHTYTGGLGQVAAGVTVLLFPAVLGAEFRLLTITRRGAEDRVKTQERELLARDLHDSIAHHVSAIAIQAQAGRTVAASDPLAAVRSLETIEAEAKQSLAEMRTIVSALRQGQDADLAPQRGVEDITRLAGSAHTHGRVQVELTGDLTDLRPSVHAAVYRMAQEAITNAIRHARNATQIHVRVDGTEDQVSLTVKDDGESAATRNSAGYGLIGMAERATLLGGTLEAGPSRTAGWTVTASLPKDNTGR